MSTATVTGRTGEKCKISGVYYCGSHPEQTIPIAIGNTFPPCRETNHATTWYLRRRA